MRRLDALIALALLAAPVIARAEDPRPIPGVYDGLMLGFDPATRQVTGYFSEVTVRGQFSCIFYLTGRLQGAKAAITTYYPETPAEDTIKGELRLSTSRAVQISLPAEHGGCWNVEHFADKDRPAALMLDTPHPWSAVAVVKSARAYFYDAAAAKTRRKGYVVQGDGLGVRATRGGWLQVDFVSGSKPVSGWIQRSDVYPAE